MTVYVDPSAFPYRRQLYCHVWADTVEELHAAAQAAGLKREWFQCPPKASWEHYDCAPRIRAILVRNGAVETDKYGPAYHVARLNSQSEDPETRAYGEKMIAMIERCRVKFAKPEKEEKQLALDV